MKSPEKSRASLTTFHALTVFDPPAPLQPVEAPMVSWSSFLPARCSIDSSMNLTDTGVSEGVMDDALRILTIGALGFFSKSWLSYCNDLTVYRGDLFLKTWQNHRPAGLITVSNHASSVDDPAAISALLPYSAFYRPDTIRWTMCAVDRCFKNPYLAPMFHYGKVLPLERGGGLHQQYMELAQGKVNAGEWLHIFPEGTRTRDGRLQKARLGIGKLVADATRRPVVLPIFFRGVDRVVPQGAKFPKTSEKVTIHVGEPICFEQVYLHHAKEVSRLGLRSDSMEATRLLYTAIAKRVEDALRELEVEADTVNP